jgi:hypothetical protein
MKKLIPLFKKSVLSLTLLSLLVFGSTVTFPTVASADAGGAPRVIEVWPIYIGNCVTVVYVRFSNGDSSRYAYNSCLN